MAKLNKTDLVDAMAASHPTMMKVAASAALDALIALIRSAVADGDQVAIAGFGTFSRKDRAARKGHNPATGAAMDIPASSGLHFKASKSAI